MRKRIGIFGAVATVVALAVGYVAWDVATDSLTGPNPTVAAEDSCDGGAPSAVLAFDASTGEPRWSALAGDSWHLGLTDGTVAASGGGRLRALDVADGQGRWCRAFEPDGEILGAVAADGAIVGSEGDSIVAYGARDGERLWSRAGTGDWLLTDGELAVIRRRSGGTEDLTTTALVGGTGEERWTYRTSPPDNGFYPSAPLVAAPDLGLTYVHDTLGVVAAGTPDDGGAASRWTEPVLRPIGVDGDVLVGGVAESFTDPLTRFRLQGRDAATGAVRWERSVPGSDARVVGGVVVVLHHTEERDAPEADGTRWSGDGPLRPSSPESATVATGYDAVDGRVRWRRDLPFSAQVHAAGPVAVVWAPDAGAGDGRLLALDPATGDVAWRSELANPARSERYHLGDDVTDAVYDEASDTFLVLVAAREPYRD